MPNPDANFAEDPLLKPLFNYKLCQSAQTNAQPRRHEVSYIWMDTNAVNKLQAFDISRGGSNVPLLPLYRFGRALDLAEWVSYFQSCTNFPPSAPAEDPVVSILHSLSRFDDDLSALKRASKTRPKCTYNIHYDEGMD